MICFIAIIQNQPLPPKDRVIVIIDDEDADLIINYGVEPQVPASEEEEPTILHKSSAKPTSLQETHTVNKHKTLLDNRKDLEEKLEDFRIVEPSKDVDKISDLTIPNNPDACKDTIQTSQLHGESNNSQHKMDRSSRVISQSKQSQDQPKKSQPATAVVESNEFPNSINKEPKASVVQSDASKNAVEQSKSTPNLAGSAESESTPDVSNLTTKSNSSRTTRKIDSIIPESPGSNKKLKTSTVLNPRKERIDSRASSHKINPIKAAVDKDVVEKKNRTEAEDLTSPPLGEI